MKVGGRLKSSSFLEYIEKQNFDGQATRGNAGQYPDGKIIIGIGLKNQSVPLGKIISGSIYTLKVNH